MTVKWGRTYSLELAGRPIPLPPTFAGPLPQVTSGVNIITLEYPLTLKFNVSRHTFSEANTMNLQIYNLSDLHQKQIYWDEYLKSTPIPIKLKAGYQTSPTVPLIFSGYVKLAYTERIGPDTITHIEAYDGGFGMENGSINYTAPAKTSFVDIFTALVNGGTKDGQYIGNGLPGVTAGEVLINPLPLPLTEAQTFSGSTLEQIQKIVPQGGNFFVDNGVAHIIGFNEQLSNFLGTLSSSSGLLGVPKRYGYHVSASCVFEPRLQLGQTLKLESEFVPWVNGMYQVIGFQHHGTISGVESGEATTEIDLFSTQTPVQPLALANQF